MYPAFCDGLSLENHPPNTFSSFPTSTSDDVVALKPLTDIPGDVYDQHSFYTSATTAYCQPAINVVAKTYSLPQIHWASSPTAQQSTFSEVHPLYDIQEQQLDFNMPVRTSSLRKDRFRNHVVASADPHSLLFEDGNSISNTNGGDSVMQELPIMTPDQLSGVISSSNASQTIKLDHSIEKKDANPSLVQKEHEPFKKDGESKIRTPYAQEIYRALTSKEPHVMTLKEIYQWFRNNTDKANREDNGWQNSIRHNLSMNDAFVKPNKMQTPTGNAASWSNETNEKSTEWALKDWAVRDGVQRTTRYRTRNSGRRTGSGSLIRSQHTQHISSRAPSGRKGGVRGWVVARVKDSTWVTGR